MREASKCDSTSAGTTVPGEGSYSIPGHAFLPARHGGAGNVCGQAPLTRAPRVWRYFCNFLLSSQASKQYNKPDEHLQSAGNYFFEFGS